MSKTVTYFLSEHARERLSQRQIEADWVDLVLKLGYCWKAKGARFYRLKPEIASVYPIPLLQRLTVVVQSQTVITAYFDGVLSAERYRKLVLKGRRKAWQKAQYQR